MMIKQGECVFSPGLTRHELAQLWIRSAVDASDRGMPMLLCLGTATEAKGADAVLRRVLGPPSGWPASLGVERAVPALEDGCLALVEQWLERQPATKLVAIYPFRCNGRIKAGQAATMRLHEIASQSGAAILCVG